MTRKMWLIGIMMAVLILAAGGLLCARQAQGIVWADEATQPSLLQGQAGETGEAGDPLGLEAADGRPTRRWQEAIVRGTVTEVNGDEVLVKRADDELATVLITDTTRLWVPGEPPTTTVELQVGDPVLAFGQPLASDSGEQVVSARLIAVASDEELPKILVRGRAVAVTEQIVVVQTGRGERAITVLPRTRLWAAKGRLTSLRDLHPGETIVALGQPTSFGQWIAALVFVPDAPPLARRGLRGLVTAADSVNGTLTVQTERAETITVVTSDETRYRIAGIEKPGFDDVQVGDRIIAIGRLEEGSQTRFLARGIGVIPPTPGKEQP